MIDMVIRLLVIFHALETPIKYVEDHGLSLSTIPVSILFYFYSILLKIKETISMPVIRNVMNGMTCAPLGGISASIDQ